jgi:hypothetical protein
MLSLSILPSWASFSGAAMPEQSIIERQSMMARVEFNSSAKIRICDLSFSSLEKAMSGVQILNYLLKNHCGTEEHLFVEQMS